MIRAAGLLGLALLAAPASPAVTMSGPDGFVSASSAVVALPPAEVWAAVLQWNRWWDPAHSYSGKPGVLQLEPKAGGRLFEEFDGKSVLHATVVHVRPPELLRLDGGFGPLQLLPVNAVLDIALKPEGAGTRLSLTYRVGGPALARLDEMATPVDGVMSAGFQRLVRFVNTGNPEETR
jgi:uncharacterized protein YndB with AHSA1/START domain